MFKKNLKIINLTILTLVPYHMDRNYIIYLQKKKLLYQFLKGVSTDHMVELNQREKERVFNLGYYTWVEQQGIDLSSFEKRRDQKFWLDHYNRFLSLDDLLEQFNSN